MAEINLRSYIQRIEAMIQSDKLEEAIANSSHILESYPKNAAAYRTLSRALMMQSRDEEASEILRRLLTAFPDDFTTHFQLSVIYERQSVADAALWHIERAFDQQPNNKTVIERLRALYLKLRDLEVGRIQLTAGAVATQYMKARMYDDVIDLLRRNLKRMPDRTDLRLQLARAYWETGNLVEAAEHALEVLKRYPYAVDANQILTDLWLQEERPSDAQRYLSRIEDVDPYLAYEIATDAATPDDTFTLEELDYRKYTLAQVGDADDPDWLDTLAVDDFSAADEVAEPTDDAWLADLSEIDAPPQADTTPRKTITDSLEGLLPEDADIPASAGTDDTVDADDIALDELFADESEDARPTRQDGDVVDHMADFADENAGASRLLSRFRTSDFGGQDDDDDWLKELTTGRFDTGGLGDGGDDIDEILGDEADIMPDSTDDFFASLDDEDEADEIALDEFFGDGDDDDNLVTDISEDDDEFFDFAPSTSTSDLMAELMAAEDDSTDSDDALAGDDSDDPLAWMQGSDIDYDEDDQEDDYAAALRAEADAPTSVDSEGDDPLAWMQESGVEYDDESADDDEDDPLAWMQESGIEFYDDDELDDEPIDDLGFTEGLAAAGSVLADDDDDSDDEVTDDSDDLSWLTDDSVLDDMLELEDLHNTEDFETQDDDFLLTEADGQDSMNDSPNDDMNDEFDESLDGLEWLDDEDGEDQDFAEEIDMSDADDADDDMAWLTDGGADLDDTATDDDEMPVAATDANDPMAWLTDDDDDDFDFADDFDDDATDFGLAVAEGADEPIFGEEDDDDFDFGMFDDELDEDDDFGAFDDELGEDDDFGAFDDDLSAESDDIAPAAGISSGMLNFLSGDADSPPDEDLDEIDEMSAFADDEEESEWLAAINDDTAGQTDELLDWTQDPDDALAETDTDDDAPVPADTDWMSELDGAALDDDDDDDDSTADDFGAFVASLDDDDDDLDEGEWDTLDVSGDRAEDFGFAFDDEDDDFADDDAPVPADADWMSELDGATLDDDDEDDDFGDFAATLDDDDELELAEGEWDTLDVSGDRAEDFGFAFDDEDDDFADDFDTEDPIDEPDWLAGLEDEMDEAPAVTSGMTGMLNDIRSSRDEDEDADIDEAAVADDDFMLEDDDDFDDFDIDEDEAFADDDELDWLTAVEGEADSDPAEKGDDDLETVTVPVGEDDTPFEEEVDFEEADTAPDWLNAMVPGMDIDFTAEEDETEEEFIEEGTGHRARTLNEDNLEVIKDFAWLQKIVDEETSGMEPVRPGDADEDYVSTPMRTTRRRRFSFSTLPAWANGRTADVDSASDDATEAGAMTSVGALLAGDAGTSVDDLADDVDDFDFDDEDLAMVDDDDFGMEPTLTDTEDDFFDDIDMLTESDDDLADEDFGLDDFDFDDFDGDDETASTDDFNFDEINFDDNVIDEDDDFDFAEDDFDDLDFDDDDFDFDDFDFDDDDNELKT